jgi:peptidyl-tRNA hydrolase
LGTEDFTRLRLGIATETVMRPSENYVLAPFRKSDLVKVDEVMVDAVKGIMHYSEEGIESTMNQYNTRSPE